MKCPDTFFMLIVISFQNSIITFFMFVFISVLISSQFQVNFKLFQTFVSRQYCF
jgi:hypothetical protein